MTDTLQTRATALIEALGLGTAADVTEVAPLTGGVASDIARVTVGPRTFAVKFALARLRVAAEWHAPVHRSRAEYAWLTAAARVAPDAVPRLFGYDDGLNGFAMDYLPAPNWKTALLAGGPATATATTLADILGRIHAAGAAPGFDPTPFRNAADFHALRTEPYLLYTATRHSAVAARLRALATSLDTAALTLVHGDVSPKNILLRPSGPVILDAECATMGDPAFDLAFCLNHLLLKSIHLPASRAELRAAARAFWTAYAPHITWEPPAALAARLAALVPALMLARVDGKSPVEYLTPAAQSQVRALALDLLATPTPDLPALLDRIDTA